MIVRRRIVIVNGRQFEARPANIFEQALGVLVVFEFLRGPAVEFFRTRQTRCGCAADVCQHQADVAAFLRYLNPWASAPATLSAGGPA